jgi:hypothetical protein
VLHLQAQTDDLWSHTWNHDTHSPEGPQ